MAHVGRHQGWAWFVANPGPHDCRLLVPGSPARAAAQAVRRYHDGASGRQRLVMAATELALRLGAGHLLGRRVVSIAPPCRPGVIEFLSSVLDSPVEAFAMTLGPRRFNRKPVLQLFDPAGDTIGFAKIAVDEPTDAMVDREAHWLGVAHRSSGQALRVPRPLWAGRFDGRAVSVIEPCWAIRRPPQTSDVDVELVTAVHALGAPRRAPLRRSAPVAALERSPRPEPAEALRLLGPRSDILLDLGAWHGDLTPWNLLTTRSGRVVIDWETAEGGHPLGVDWLHHHVAAAMQLTGEDAGEAVRTGLRAWSDIAPRLGLSAAAATATADVLLLEYVRRDLELEESGRTPSGLAGPALQELARD